MIFLSTFPLQVAGQELPEKNFSQREGQTSGSDLLLARRILVLQGDGRKGDDHSHESYHMLKAEGSPLRTTVSSPRWINQGPGKKMISSWASCWIKAELALAPALLVLLQSLPWGTLLFRSYLLWLLISANGLSLFLDTSMTPQSSWIKNMNLD